LKGGKAGAKALSPKRQAEIAEMAAAKRWSKEGIKLGIFFLIVVVAESMLSEG
jgi:hypothetical protein